MTSAIARVPRPHDLVAPGAATGPASRAIAATVSIAGSAVAFIVAGLGLLTVPIAAILAFGPALWESL